MRQESTLFNSGSLGNNQAANTLVTLINAPGPGVYKVWGQARHTLADGFKLTSPVAITFPGTPNVSSDFGPFIVVITNTTSGINIALNTATGAADTASAVIYAERLSQ